MNFEFQSLDFSRLDRGVRGWREFRRLLDAPDLPDAHRRVYEARLKETRRELDAARADLDRQRKAEIDAWAKPRGLRVDWSNWDRA